MAHIWAARALLPEMLERGEGHLVSTASAAGLTMQVSAMPYTVTKHAAVSVAEWLAVTYAERGIGVSCLCPQAVETPMLDAAREDPVGGAILEAGGVLSPEEAAAAAIDGLKAGQVPAPAPPGGLPPHRRQGRRPREVARGDAPSGARATGV